MRFYTPVLRPGVRARSPELLARLFGGATGEAEPAERFGGVPHGLAAADWPYCGECGRSLSLIAQLAHHEDRLPLGRAGRMLFAFQCNHEPGTCETWDQDSGANAAFVVEPEAIGDRDTPTPLDAPPPDPVAFVTGWTQEEDGLTAEEASAFFSDETIAALGEDLIDEERHGGTHLGGIPCWIQSADEAPRGWRFLGQIADGHEFEEEIVPGHNFGDMGIAYLFAQDQEEGVPKVKMFWQCG